MQGLFLCSIKETEEVLDVFTSCSHLFPSMRSSLKAKQRPDTQLMLNDAKRPHVLQYAV